MWQIIKTIFSVIGAITTIIGVIELYQRYILTWLNKRRAVEALKRTLDINDYFFAHIIHMGGQFSTTYSMQVFSNEEGGYYFGKEFVGVSFNRGGDFMIITMPVFIEKANFVIDSFGEYYDILEKSTYPDICHLPINSLKNEYYIKFIKLRR